MHDNFYFLGFSAFSGIGPKRFCALYKHFGSATKAWEAPPQLLKEAGLGDLLISQFGKFRNSFSLVDYKKKLEKANVSFLTLRDIKYPKLLKEIENPPFVLYVKGSFDFNKIFSSYPPVAVVGTRNVSTYGQEVTQMITRELVVSGCSVVSGLALGVDTIAHKETILQKGITVAVLGCGVDCCYPTTNDSLYNSISETGGAVMSEVPLGQKPSRGLFPARNRIIAGLSKAVVVTEGAEDSGALITAEYAIKNKRHVFAVPGPITSSLSKGPYKLISQGARLVTSAQDIIKSVGAYGSSEGKKKIYHLDSKEEKNIVDSLAKEPLHFDQLAKITKISSSKLAATLSMMEIKGIVTTLQNGTFSLLG